MKSQKTQLGKQLGTMRMPEKGQKRSPTTMEGHYKRALLKRGARMIQRFSKILERRVFKSLKIQSKTSTISNVMLSLLVLVVGEGWLPQFSPTLAKK